MTETLIDHTYEPCAQCGAPLDDAQRYCVFCGASRHHAADPVARYLAAARRRPAAAAPPVAVATASTRSDRWLLLALVLLPLAAAAGVLVGRSGAGNADLVAALRAQKAPVVQVGGAAVGTTAAATGAGGAAAASGAKVATSFPLATGFTVELRTLPSGAGGTAVAAATAAAQKQGAKDVGVFDPANLDVRPDPGKRLVVFSGAFHARAAAVKALGTLKHDFPGAKVIAIKAGSSSTLVGADAPVPKHPTAKQKSDGAKIVQQIQSAKGKAYVDQQRKLPDTIVVP